MRIDSVDAALRALAPGRRMFGRYTLEAIAGRGGMGVVWRARDEELERTVALKFLPEAVAADPEAIRDLKRETRRCLELTHPHIVRVYDFVQDGGSAAIAMEFVDGESLAKRKAVSAGGCLPASELAPLVEQLCSALDYAHLKARIVHRDLKPANLLVTSVGDLKITDFGIARSLTESQTRLTGLTTGSTSGTLPYMSPQQLAGDKPAASDDIYALGATLCELLTGKPPFYRGDVASMIIQIRERTPAPLNEHRLDVGCDGQPIPEKWSQTTLACLNKNPAQRPRSAGEVAQRLGLASGVPPSLPEPASDETVVALPRVPLPAATPPEPPVLGKPPPTPLPPPIAPTVNTPPPAVVTVGAGPAPARTSAGRRGLLVAAIAAAAVLAATGYYFGVHAPTRSRNAAEQERLRIAEANRAAQEKSVAEQRARDEAARVQAMQEQQAYEAIAAKVDAMVDGVGEAQRQSTNAAVAAYLATAPDRSRDELELRWARRVEGWEAARLAAARGGLSVNTTPAGAEVTVGTAAITKSPATLKDMRLGKYPVVVRLPGYVDQRAEVEVKENEFATLDLVLVRATGIAQIVSSPPGLRFVLGGPEKSERGTTPATLSVLPTGEYTVTVSRPGWPDVQQRLSVVAGRTASIVAEFVGGAVEVTSEPSGAEVWAQGRQVGRTPYNLRDVIPAAVEFELRLSGYQNGLARGEVRARDTARFNVALQKIPGPVNGDAWTVPDVGVAMIWLPPGRFVMGTPAYQAPAAVQTANPNDPNAAVAALIGGLVGIAQGIKAMQHANESPQTTVSLTRGYWLGKTEVTQAQFENVMGRNPSQFKAAGGEAPVENVTWDEAMEFCSRLTARERAASRLPEGAIYTLPSEAQWENACRAGTTVAYAGTLELMAWFASNSGNSTHRVGLRQSNAWGFYDMHGNVAEWCLDRFGTYPGGAVADYVGVGPGGARAYRGGNCKSDAENCYSTSRVRERPGTRSNLVGFRLALVQNR
ncbi:MAG: PEGA domain-containing protein [Verrucomicrobia bacterium]|nr:PEGA domain-containing protein [Verrucomicrobiota bacterium]